MKKQDIVNTLLENPKAVFNRTNGYGQDFTILNIRNGGYVIAQVVGIDRPEGNDPDEWTVNLKSNTFTIMTREVGEKIADSPEEWLEKEKQAERERQVRFERDRLETIRRRALGVRLMQALQGFGIEHDFYEERDLCADWNTIGWWGLMRARFDLDLTDEIERLISLIEHAKVEA